MNKCYLCLTTEKESVLYKGIHKKEGVVHVCRKCYFKDKIPLVQDKEINVEEIKKMETVRERLSRMSHFEPRKTEENVKIPNSADLELKGIVENNFKKESVTPVDSSLLVDKFHWIVMRKRRSMKITQEDFAKAIQEPLVAIESLEKGILPRDYSLLIKKVEAYLKISLFKEKRIGPKDILTESRIPSGISIDQVKKETLPQSTFSKIFSRREKVEEKEEDLIELDEDYVDPSTLSLEKVEEVSGKASNGFSKKKASKDELSDEDISKLIWGK